MRIYWKYRCDYGHTWSFFREEKSIEIIEDVICPFGHEAVTLQKGYPVDELEICFRSGGYSIDRVKGQILDEDKYYLVLRTIDGEEKFTSTHTYTWDAVIILAAKFRGRSNVWVNEMWDRWKI